MADLQTVLGDLHDSAVTAQWLRDAAAACPSCGVVVGQLIAAEHTTQAGLRERWYSVWQAASTTAIGAWL